MSKQAAAAVFIGILALGIRLPGLGKFMTADEENWMLRSGQFYHNLFRNYDTGGAFMTTHPGATAMWIAGAGIVWQEARLGFDIDTSNIADFRRAALIPMVLAISLLLGITTWQISQLFGVRAGVISGILLALEPYFAGMSQIVHLDMLLALLMVNSVLAFFLHQLRHPRGIGFAATSGVFGGLAMATKLLPTLWLFVFFGLVSFLSLSRKASSERSHATALWLRVEQVVRQAGFVFGIAVLTFYVTWPALWFTADLGRSFERDVPSVIQNAHVAIEDSSEQIAPASFYVRTVLGRTTPFVMIVVFGSLIAAIVHPHLISPSREGEKQRGWVLWLLLYALGFLLMITFAAKKADRYALPALITLPIIAGWALGRIPTLRSRSVKWGAVLLASLLMAQILLLSPHMIAYNNPLFDIRPLSQQGWGEGLEEAAEWLNGRPLASEIYIASWYPSVMQTYFHGKTLSLSSRYDDRVGYVVLYRNMFGRGAEHAATIVLGEFQNKKPAHIIHIQDVPYAWIYDVRGLHYFPQHVGELYGEESVGQLIPVEENNWSSIEIGLATFSSRHNTQDVVLHVREYLEAIEDIRTVRVNARKIQDSSYHRFEFEPILSSTGKTYYVFLESPASYPGDAVTVRFANQDRLAGEMVRNGKVLLGRDVAWRIPE